MKTILLLSAAVLLCGGCAIIPSKVDFTPDPGDTVVEWGGWGTKDRETPRSAATAKPEDPGCPSDCN